MDAAGHAAQGEGGPGGAAAAARLAALLPGVDAALAAGAESASPVPVDFLQLAHDDPGLAQELLDAPGGRGVWGGGRGVGPSPPRSTSHPPLALCLPCPLSPAPPCHPRASSAPAPPTTQLPGPPHHRLAWPPLTISDALRREVMARMASDSAQIPRLWLRPSGVPALQCGVAQLLGGAAGCGRRSFPASFVGVVVAFGSPAFRIYTRVSGGVWGVGCS
jgi:hypothetical protein